MAELSAVERMYSWSMDWYEARFSDACCLAEACSSLDERLLALRGSFTITLYRAVCRSLFERHKLLFSLALTGRVLEVS